MEQQVKDHPGRRRILKAALFALAGALCVFLVVIVLVFSTRPVERGVFRPSRAVRTRGTGQHGVVTDAGIVLQDGSADGVGLASLTIWKGGGPSAELFETLTDTDADTADENTVGRYDKDHARGVDRKTQMNRIGNSAYNSYSILTSSTLPYVRKQRTFKLDKLVSTEHIRDSKNIVSVNKVIFPGTRNLITQIEIAEHRQFRPEHPRLPRRVGGFYQWDQQPGGPTTECSADRKYNGPSRPIKDRMDDQCTELSKVFRAWIDNFVPPKECRVFDGNERLRCLAVSKEQSPIAILLCVLFGIASGGVLLLLLIALIKCVKHDTQTIFGTPKRSRSVTIPRFFSDPRTGDVERQYGIEALQRRYRDQGSQRSRDGSVLPGYTLDGSNDGWTQWIKKKRINGHTKTSSPAPKQRAPRIPSLKLPTATLATVRKASGLDPYYDSVSKGKPQVAKSAKRDTTIHWETDV